MNTERQVIISMTLAVRVLKALSESEGEGQLCREFNSQISEAQKPRFKIFGRRWFQRTYGNTYFKFSIEKDGEEIYCTKDMAYGYGDHYQTEAIQWLVKNGHIQNKGEGIPSWKYRDDNYIEFSVQDFERKKDF